MVATDAHRLALSWLPLPPDAHGIEGAILSRKTIQELSKIITESDEGEIKVSFSNAQVAFQIQDLTLYSRLVQGTFPNYQQAIPKDNKRILTLDTRAFEEAVDRVSMVSQYDKVRTIKLHIEKSKLNLSARGSDNGFGCEEIAIQYDADPFEIGFNARYVLDVLKQIKSKNFQISFGQPPVPAVVKDLDDEDVLYVLMPMRV